MILYHSQIGSPVYYSFKTLDKMTAFERNSAPHRYFKFVQDYFGYIMVIVTLQQAGVWLIRV
jgi:hypothetical protein